MTVDFRNPYWDYVEPGVRNKTGLLGNPMHQKVIGGLGNWVEGDRAMAAENAFAWFARRDEAVWRWSWSVPDPDTLEFVVKWSGAHLIDPMAGTGYWVHLLKQRGVDCRASDRNPPAPGSTDNIWHPDTETWTTVDKLDAVESVSMMGAGRTLFLSWPPDSDAAYHTLLAYPGDRFIFIGEHATCGEEQFYALLDEEWSLIDYYPIVQWDCMNDRAYVYARNGSADARKYSEEPAQQEE